MHSKDKEAGNIARKWKNHHDYRHRFVGRKCPQGVCFEPVDKFAGVLREKMRYLVQAATNDDIATLIQNEISGNTIIIRADGVK